MDDILLILEKLIKEYTSKINQEKLLKPCPKCGIKPKDPKEIVSIFGFRQMIKNNPKSIIRQSYCKKCR